MKRFTHNFLQKYIEDDQLEEAALLNPESSLEEFPDITVEEDCAAVVVIECLYNLD